MAGYKFSGIDIQEAYGFFASGDRVSSNSIEKPASAKPVFTKDWGGDDGTEIDTDAPVRFQSRKFTISGTLVATSEAQYKSRKQALTSAVLAPYIPIFQPEINETVMGRFTGFSTWERQTQVKGSSLIVTKITIEFDEVTEVTDVTEPSGSFPYLLPYQLIY